jgi:cell filamentation protein
VSKELKTISSKYTTDYESEYQPKSRRKVLKNKAGIISIKAMEDAELAGYMAAERKMVELFEIDQQLCLEDIHTLHRLFLGKLYEWAGNCRTVNLTKDGFPFASAYALPQALQEFETKILKPNTPCRGMSIKEIAWKIAVVHTELLLLHPYREGNGRTARLLATLMAYQANLQGIDFGFIGSKGKNFHAYIHAIQTGNNEAMQQIILKALHRAGAE